ncbi:hypothetical protein Peur_008019 [Populus x canadensis]
MMMGSQDQMMGSKELKQIIKGKRIKRPRPSLALTLAMTSSSSSSAGESGGERDQRIYNNLSSSPSPNTSFEFTERTGEEEDMANCLILLAQGNQNCKLAKLMAIAAAATITTSHKKPKPGNLDHECSVYGAEFSSGQTLGGYMRRHRVFVAATSTTTITMTTTMSLGRVSSPDHESQESKKPRNNLQLDLNLLAPKDDLLESKFHFASNEQVLVLTASPLVDYHY